MKSAKAHLLNIMKNHSDSSSATQSPKPPPSTRRAEEPHTKHFCHLASFLGDLRKTRKSLERNNQVNKNWRLSIHSNESLLARRCRSCDISDQAGELLLATLAVEVLTMPASSTPVERIFSAAGESSCGKRN